MANLVQLLLCKAQRKKSLHFMYRIPKRKVCAEDHAFCTIGPDPLHDFFLWTQTNDTGNIQAAIVLIEIVIGNVVQSQTA